MVELKQLSLALGNALEIKLLLPRGLLYFIIKDHMVICGSSINMPVLLKKHPQLCIIQCDEDSDGEQMLKSHAIFCSLEASKLGALNGMCIHDILTLLSQED